MVICLRQFVLVLIYGCTFARGICTDTAVLGYCTASVCSNQQARSVCLRTCGFCLDSQGGAPAFAQPPPNVNVMSRPENNYNGHSINNEKTNPLAAPALPMWAVILIVVVLVVLFTTCVCTYFHCKRKRKLKRNNRNVEYPKDTNNESYNQHNSLRSNDVPLGWMINHHTGEFLDSNGTGEKAYWQQNNLNESVRPDNAKKNINVIYNDTQTIKRKAPPPPSPPHPPSPPPKTYESLQYTSERSGNKSQTEVSANSSDENSANHVENLNGSTKSENIAGHNVEEQRSPPRTLPRTKSMPLSLPQPANSNSSILCESGLCKNNTLETISRRVSSDTNTYTDNNVYGASSVDETSTYQLCGILQDWKQHLSAQKSELQHYYKSMVSALERDAVEPIDSASNVGHYDESVPSELSFRRLNEQSSSEYTGVRGSTVLSDGTLSVLGDYDCHANDIKRQERVIQQIKLKIADLESLLDNTRNISCDPDDDTESMYMASPPYRSYSLAQNTVVNKPTARKTIIHTINGLVSKLNNEDRECCFNMINGVLIESRNHRGMAMREKNVNQTVVTRLARQIHHVMRDAIHPEQRTDILLAVYAARNLVDRLSKSAKMETFFLHSVPSLQTIGLQLVENVEQLFQMSNHLKKQAVSYKKQDIFRFVQSFIRIAQKIMALSYTLVSECYHAMNLETRERVPINHTRKQIRQNLNSQKISILNNELTNLEQLLKSGDPMVAQLSANEGPVVESSCDNLSDSDMESVTSCSTCISNETQKPVKRARNPYLFPGGPDSVDQNVQPSSFQSQSVVIDNNRLPTRPVKNSLPVNPYNRQPESGTDVKEAYLKGNNFSNQTSTHFFESDRMHQVEASEHLLYAKQLNQLVRSKPKESRMRYDVGTTEITECKKNVCGDLNTYAETKIDESLPKQIKKEKQHTNVKKETVSSSYNNDETFCSGDGSQLNQTEPKEDSASCVKKGEEGDYDALCTLSMKGELSEGTEHEVAKNPDLKLKLKDERNVLEE